MILLILITCLLNSVLKIIIIIVMVIYILTCITSGSERVNLLTPRSDQFINSPYIFNTLSGRQVMRIKKIINYGILS